MFNHICEYCGKEFSVYSDSQKFCSRECYSKYGKEIGKYGKTICPVCGKEFRKQRPNHIFCSRKCRGINDRKRVTFRCDICGKVTTRIISDFDKCNHHYCSVECRKAGLGWNDKDTQILRENYKKKKYSEMVNMFSEPKTVEQIRARAIYIGLTHPRDWNEDEIAILKDNYSIKPMDVMLSLLPNRTRSSITGQARQQKLYSYFYLHNSYSDDAEEFIRSNYLSMSNKELGDVLGRPEHGIEQHLYQMDLHRPREIDKYIDVKRYIRSRLTPWRDQYRRDCNFTCALTGLHSNVIVHHIRSFNLILNEAIENICFHVCENMSEYTEEQLDELFNEFMNLQEYYHQYICINEDVHIHFHTLYGYGENTLEQWNEFVNTYYS